MKKISFLLLTLGLLGALPLISQAIGQITEPIEIKDAIRGQEIVSKITLLNSEKTESLIGIVAEGQIADWTVFYNKEDKEYATPITEINIPAGAYLDVAVLFRVPADTANGQYTGKISVVYNPTQSSATDESSSTVAQKISRAVKITVSDKEVIALNASVIPEKFDYAPGEPMKIRIIYDNQSNIVLTPSVQVKIKQDEKTVYNVIYPYPEGESAVRSMSLHEIPALTVPTDNLQEGDYLAELTFLRGENNLLSKNFSFSVAAGAGLDKDAVFSYLKNNLAKLIGGLIIFVAVIAIIVIGKKRASRGASNNESNGNGKK